jgi:predicted AAA+ superfamily ATPase
VAQELTASNRKPLYFWRGKISEIDFLIATDLGVVPVEVKSGALTRSKSLAAYAEKFKPPSAIRLSGRNSSFARGAIIDLPLYLAGQVNRYLAPDGN